MAEWLEQETIYEGALVTLKRGRVRFDEDHIVPFDVVEHHGGVAVVPYLDGRVFLVRQPRPVVGLDLLEIPAGKLEGPDDDVIGRAQAELGEEVGYRAGRLVPATEFFVSPGYCTERIHVFLGLDLVEVESHPEVTEQIERVELSIDDVRRMLDAREFRDSKTIIGLRELLAYLDRVEGAMQRG